MRKDVTVCDLCEKHPTEPMIQGEVSLAVGKCLRCKSDVCREHANVVGVGVTHGTDALTPLAAFGFICRECYRTGDETLALWLIDEYLKRPRESIRIVNGPPDPAILT